MNRFKSTFSQYVALTLFCFVFYGNTVLNDYAYDDAVVITENQFTQRGLAGIPEIFTYNTFRGSYGSSPTVERYRPLSVATFAIENQIFGASPHVSHFNNVLLLGLTSLILYKLLSRVFGTGLPGKGFIGFPLLATLLLIAHPVHTETVANIKGRDEILALAGCLGSTLLLARYSETGRRKDWLWASVCFLLSLFAKENAITFLLVAPLTLYYGGTRGWKALGRALLPLAAATVVFLVIRRLATGGAGPLPADDIITEPFLYASTAERFATIFLTFGKYLRLLVFPHPLTIDYYPYHVQLAHFGDAGVWLSIVAYAAAAVFAVVNLKRKSVVSYGIIVYLATFSVVSNLPFSIGTFMSERFMFMPSLGFVLVVAWLLSKISEARVRHGLLLAVLLPALFLTIRRNHAWKNDFTLFTTDAQTSSRSIKGNLVAALSFLEESQKTEDAALFGDYRAKALKHAKIAISLYERFVPRDRPKGPSYEHAFLLLGDCFAANDKPADALHSYEHIINSATVGQKATDAIEAMLSKSNNLDFKIKSYSELVNLVPDSFVFNYRLGYIYGREKNDLPMAVRFLQRSVDLRPDETHALEALSHAYKLTKDYAKAALYLEKATGSNAPDLASLKKLLNLYNLAGNSDKEREVKEKLDQLQGPMQALPN